MKKIMCLAVALAFALGAYPLAKLGASASESVASARMTATSARPYANRVLEHYKGIASKESLTALGETVNSLAEGYNPPAAINKVQTAIDEVIKSAKTKELYNVQLMSDVHMSPRNSAEEGAYGDTQKAFTDAMNFALELFPDTKGLIVAGDITNFGRETEYARYVEAIQNSGMPFVFTAIGNHEYNDYWDDPLTAQKNFLTNINKYYEHKGFPTADKVYYDTYIENTHVIALGSEGAPARTGPDDKWSDTKATISDAQLKWFESKLAETNPGEPIFVILHQPLENTHWLSDEWGVGEKDAELKAILSNYPQAVIISGHVHNGYVGDKAYFNDGYGVCLDMPAFQYNDYANFHEDVGYTVSVYSDKIIFTPINFTRKEILYGDILSVDRAEAEKKAATYDAITGTAQSDGGILIENPDALALNGVRLAAAQGGSITACSVQISDDGVTYSPLVTEQFDSGAAQKIHFPQTSANFLKLSVTAQGEITAYATTYGTDMSELRELYRTAMHYNAKLYNADQTQNLLAELKLTQALLESRTAAPERLTERAEKLRAAYNDRTEPEPPAPPSGSDSEETENKSDSGCGSSASAHASAAAATALSAAALSAIALRRKKTAR